MYFNFLLLGSLCIIGSYSAWVKEMENDGLYEGDIVLNDEQKKALASGNLYATTIGKQWPNGKIYYSFASDIARNSRATSAVMQAIEEYHSRTCLRFERRTSQRAYIEFFVGQGCYSNVGYTGGRMRISLGNGCWYKHIAVHEIMHALGVFHEQSRPDRDQYVTINWQNIKSSMRHNFDKATNVDSLGTPYDYVSVMHYESTAFSTNGRPTIQRKDGSTNFSNKQGMSSIDAMQLNLLYKRQCGGTTNPRTQRPWTQRPWTQRPWTQGPPSGCRDTHPACNTAWTKSSCALPGVSQFCKRMCNAC